MQGPRPEWTSQSEFVEDNSLARNTGGPLQHRKGPTDSYRDPASFTVATTLKLHFDPGSRDVAWRHRQHMTASAAAVQLAIDQLCWLEVC